GPVAWVRGPCAALLLLPLGSVAAAGLLTALDSLGVEGAADDLVTHTREVLHTTAADEHDRVLLQVVALTGDVRGDLDLARELHTGALAECGVRLLGSGRVHTGAHAAPLRAAPEGRRRVLRGLVLPSLADELLNGGH